MAAYVHGNVVTKPAEQPNEVRQREQKKRSKTVHLNRGYVMFLIVAAIVALFACVQYLQLQSDIMKRSKEITSMQRELSDAKEANTTKQNAIMNSMNLEEIRDIAINEFGMVPVEPQQIINYNDTNGSTMKQYADIPDSGIVASSDVVE